MLLILKHFQRFIQAGLLMGCILSACNSRVADATPVTSPTATFTPSQPIASPAPSDTSAQIITIWIPPMLGSNTEAGAILYDHLSAYEKINPQVDIRLRIKAQDGPSGIIETLNAASLAAPSTLPDIVVLDPTSLHTAALKGLISPLDEILDAPQTPVWYEYAVSAAYVDGAFFGLPFTSEAEAFAYRKEAYEAEPKNWADLLGSEKTFLIPLGDQSAAFTLLQYLALGGVLSDETGRPTINLDKLTDVLEFYVSAQKAGILPLFSLQLQSAEDTWTALQQGYANGAVVPLHTFLEGSIDDAYNVTTWLTRDGSGVIPTRSFSWAVIAKASDTQALLGQILQWLLEPEFLGQLTLSLGSLPSISASMDYWPEDSPSAVISRLIRVATLEPSAEELVTFGPLLHQAIEDVLNERSTPDVAAKSILDQVTIP